MTFTPTTDLAARQEIVDQLYLYCRAMDRIDEDLGYAVFHADATVDYGLYDGTGHGFIDHVNERHAEMIATSHQVANVLVTIDGDRAASEAYVRATLRYVMDGAEQEHLIHGRYCDEWSHRDGRWAITHRRYVHDFDSVREVTVKKLNVRGRRDPEDFSYRMLKHG